MLKIAVIATFGLTAAAISLNSPVSTAAPTGPCEVTSRSGVILWGRAHPGANHVLACTSLSGT